MSSNLVSGTELGIRHTEIRKGQFLDACNLALSIYIIYIYYLNVYIYDS